MKAKLLSYWKPLTAVVVWGVSFIATKIALDELAPLTIIFLRLILASILLFLLAVYSKKSFAIDKRNHGGIFILALIALMDFFTFYSDDIYSHEPTYFLSI